MRQGPERQFDPASAPLVGRSPSPSRFCCFPSPSSLVYAYTWPPSAPSRRLKFHQSLRSAGHDSFHPFCLLPLCFPSGFFPQHSPPLIPLPIPPSPQSLPLNIYLPFPFPLFLGLTYSITDLSYFSCVSAISHAPRGSFIPDRDYFSRCRTQFLLTKPIQCRATADCNLLECNDRCYPSATI